MDLLSSFTDIARSAGFELPPELAAWYREGVAHADADTPAMAEVYDFEWITPEQCRQTIDEWLNPEAQDGNRFFPFAESGAGDAYCLVRLADGREGVSMVWHDDDENDIEYATFADFVAGTYLGSYANLSYLRASLEEIGTAIRASLEVTAPALPESHAKAITAPARVAVRERTYRTGPKAKPETVPSLLPQQEAEAGAERFKRRTPIWFTVVARWDIE
ncbi:SMI1/KNR4 family protein [Bordetella genomosp. 13]|uniref:SMI1/KNR4 family protein n=1 Tax=Bordetella genomosp. 13 TaxID=463040 RepID=UPI00119F6D06|nr:SMI1/KNR4 family protein [Bordetella genomosp. 13]